MTDSTRTPAAVCWHCDRMLDAASELDGQTTPQPGAISLCLYCGAVAVFGPGLVLEPPTKALLDELAASVEFGRTYTTFSWARQYVMIQSSLMRPGSDPDR